MKKLFIILLFVLFAHSAYATSTIDTTQPASGSALASSPIRSNFGAAANDINALQAKFPVSAANGGTGSTTYPGALNNLNSYPLGSGAYIVAQCNGGGDEGAIGTAISASVNSNTSVLIPPGKDFSTACQLNNTIQLSGNEWVVAMFGWPQHAIYSGDPGYGGVAAVIRLGSQATSQNFIVPNCYLDLHGSQSWTLRDLNFMGDSSTNHDPNNIGPVVQCNSINGSRGGFPGPFESENAWDIDHVGYAQVANGIGCPVNVTNGSCSTQSYDSYGENVMQVRITFSSFGNMLWGVNGNLSDYYSSFNQYAALSYGSVSVVGSGASFGGANGIKMSDDRHESGCGSGGYACININGSTDSSFVNEQFAGTGAAYKFTGAYKGISIVGGKMTSVGGASPNDACFIFNSSTANAGYVTISGVDLNGCSHYIAKFNGTTDNNVGFIGNTGGARAYVTDPYSFATETPSNFISTNIGSDPHIETGNIVSLGTTIPVGTTQLEVYGNHLVLLDPANTPAVSIGTAVAGSTDNAGGVTVSSATTTTVTFAHPWDHAPHCIPTNTTSAGLAYGVATANSFPITFPSTTGVITWLCF